jgi:hypothetical protein
MRILINIAAAIIILILIFSLWNREPTEPRSIEGVPHNAEAFIGAPTTAKALTMEIAPHPHMAGQGVNSMHADAKSSDVHAGTAPLGINPQVLSRRGTKMPGGQCATLTFDSDGRLVALCAAISGFRIYLMEPRTLNLLALIKLPMRPSTWEALYARDKQKIMDDSSGAYFYLDDKDRVVMADSSQTVRRIGHRQNNSGEWEFYDDGDWNLSDIVPHDCVSPTNRSPEGECDPITAVMPDFDGLIWWVTRHGRVGTLNTGSGEVMSMQLNDEEIQNGFSVAEDGVFIVSDHAMYRFEADANGQPVIGWRETYDRGTSRKVGTINQGSGTTPTLLGDDYVTIADNADGRMNLIVYQRAQDFAGQRQVCSVPIFVDGHSVTDNSMIGFNRSIILENNAGYTHARGQHDWSKAGGGITRIDIREDESGCDTVWESQEHSTSTVPKLSLGSGLAYFYTFMQQDDGENAWYFTALDFETGETKFKILTGAGRDYDNNWAPITLAPDGTAYIGTSTGIVAIWDDL